MGTIRNNMIFLCVVIEAMLAGRCTAERFTTELDENFRFLAMPDDAAGERYSIRLAKTYMQPNKINSDGSFQDITYTNNTNKFSKPFRDHGDRLTRIVHSYLLPTSDHSTNYFYQNSTTLAWIAKSWEFIAYIAPDNTDWNWWGSQIGVPRSLWPGLYLSRDLINDTVYDDVIERYWTNTTVWDYEREKDGFISGSNLANRGFLGLFETYFLNNETFVTRRNQVLNYLTLEMVNKTTYQGEGVGPDYCVHIHNLHEGFYEGDYTNSHLRRMMYNGGYGAEFLKRFGAIYVALHDTSYELGDVMLSEYANMFLECHQYLVRGRTFDPSSVGRYLDDNQRVTYWASLDSVLKVAKLLLQLNHRKSEVENVITRYNNRGPTNATNALIGNKALFASDMVAHHRLGYMATLRMFSSRTVRPETWISSRRTQNPDGYYTGDGFLTILQNDNEFGSRYNQLFEEYDWEMIPGTTVEYSGQVPREGMERNVGNPNGFPHHISNADFVGSASDGMYGVSAMVYDRPTVNITMKKTWFFFDDEIVCLGSDIVRRESNEVTDELPIITTLNQILQKGQIAYSNSTTWQYAGLGQRTHIPNAKWIHHDGIGYVFPNATDASVDSFIYDTLNVTAMWMEHDDTEPYAYIIYPGVTISETEEHFTNPSVEILQQDTNSHIVYQPTLNILSMVVFNGPFSFDYPDIMSLEFTVDRACILMIQNLSSENSLSITVQFPTQENATVSITLGVLVTGDGSSCNSNGSVLQFEFSDEFTVAGKSQTKNFQIVESCTTTTAPTTSTTAPTTSTTAPTTSTTAPTTTTTAPTTTASSTSLSSTSTMSNSV